MNRRVLITLLAMLLIMAAVSIYAAPSIWVCSNHNPSHTATSAAQIQELTSRYGCTGWHRIN